MMKFHKDILIVDFEGLEKPVQIGAVLLDKETLVEKDNFISYIWTDMKGEVNHIADISQSTLDGAPTQAEVGKIFYDKFGTEVMLASWVARDDMRNFTQIITAAGFDIETYDYHIFDIWPVAYLYLLKNGYAGSMRSEEMFQAFGSAPRGSHNALEDCRLAAEVLRRIISS